MRTLIQCTGRPPRLIEQLVAVRRQVCVLAPLAGIIYMCLLTTSEFNERTRISESALLPALVTETFNYQTRITTFLRNLRQHSDRNAYVEEVLLNYRIVAERQYFRTKLPQFNRTGENVIGIVRAARSPSVEAILVAVSLEPANLEAIAVALALATHCREQLYWARDLIFVFVDENSTGMLSFLSAYYDDHRKSLDADQLHHRSGAIVGAFALKASDSSFDTLNIEYNMINGLLPNLDLINLIVKLADKFGLSPEIFEHGYQQSWQDLIETTAKGMLNQAFKNEEGVHSVFGLYGIQAVTIHTKSISERHATLTDIARISEGALRSLNNILEKFHQSYFLYILPNTRRFISVAYYMPALGLTILPLLVLALHDWFAMDECTIPRCYVFLHVIGLIEYTISRYIATSSEYAGYLQWFQFALVTPFYLFFPIDEKSARSTRFFLFLEYALIFGSLSLLNFSFAFLLSLVAVPLILVASIPTQNRLITILKSIFGFVLHPLIIYLAWQTVFAGMSQALADTYILTDNLMRAHLLLDNFVYPFGCICLLPMWNLLMQISITSC